MGYRLSKIYTRTGDDGRTGLGDGSRVAKDDPRVEAFGTVDELNCLIGVLLTGELPERYVELLTRIQHCLFDLGGELSIPGRTAIEAEHVAELETGLDALNAELSPLEEFILPGGTPAAAQAHLARAVCRRAERCCVTLARSQDINPYGIQYLNRLSDTLFVIARALNRAAGRADVLWQPRAKQRP